MQTMKKILSTLLLVLLMSPVFAEGINKETRNSKSAMEAVVLMGTVVDESTGEALPGAQVKINGLDKTLYTDLDGNFEVQNIMPGSYSIEISLVSYQENKIKDLEVKAENKNAVKVELKR